MATEHKMWAVVDRDGYPEAVGVSAGTAVREVTARFGESWSWFVERGWSVVPVTVTVPDEGER